MTKIQVKGPTKRTEGPVTYQQKFEKSPTRLNKQFWVTFKLGDRLRSQLKSKDSALSGDIFIPGGELRHETFFDPSAQYDPINFSIPEGLRRFENDPHINAGFETESSHNINSNLETSMLNPHPAAAFRASFQAPFQAQAPLQTVQSLTKDNSTPEDSECDLEILEVRPLPLNSSSKVSGTWNTSETDSDGELSCLNDELHKVLTSTTSIPTQKSPTLQLSSFDPNSRLLQNYLPLLCKQAQPRSPPPPGLKNIPPNLVNAIQREFSFFTESSTDDVVEVVGRMVFSLKDPIARTKIRLPIKATTCKHFECFDFYNFCLFYGLSTGTKNGLKTNLLMQSKVSRETEELFYKQQRQMAEGKILMKTMGLVLPHFSEHGQMFFTDVYNRTPPLYKCPLCDEKFGLKQLYISDVFNFFVKTTPMHVTKIELVQNDRYKIIEEETGDKCDNSHDVVDLDDDESSSDDNSNELDEDMPICAVMRQSYRKEDPGTPITSKLDSNRSMTSEDFDDGLDEALLELKQGDGTWLHPLTFD